MKYHILSTPHDSNERPWNTNGRCSNIQKMMKRGIVAVAALALALSATSIAQSPQGRYAAYIAQAKYQVDQARIQIEQIKLQQAEYRAQRNENAARSKDPEIKRNQDLITLKTQEMAMYQQQDSVERTPLSTNPGVAAAQQQIRTWTFEKAKLGLQQTTANQGGNAVLAAQYGRQMTAIQANIATKTQEIRLLEMKAKAGQ